MISVIFFIIGLINTQMLISGGINFGDWQFYGIIGCLVLCTTLAGCYRGKMR